MYNLDRVDGDENENPAAKMNTVAPELKISGGQETAHSYHFKPTHIQPVMKLKISNYC